MLPTLMTTTAPREDISWEGAGRKKLLGIILARAVGGGHPDPWELRWSAL